MRFSESARAWVALNLEPLVLGLAIVLIVGVAYGMAEALDDKRRGK